MSKNMKGTYNHNIDAKGRVIIPSKIRDILGREFVITLGFSMQSSEVVADLNYNKVSDLLMILFI